MEKIKYTAFRRIRRMPDSIVWGELGEFDKVEQAQKAVLDALNRESIKSRCLFYWEKSLYRCSDQEDSVYGKIEIVIDSKKDFPDENITVTIDIERFYDHENRIKAVEKALKDFMEVGDHR